MLNGLWVISNYFSGTGFQLSIIIEMKSNWITGR